MTKILVPCRLRSFPPLWNSLSDFLWHLGLRYYALFGGAIRDTDLGLPVNDYDVRGWLDSWELPIFLERLKATCTVVETPSLGTGLIRYIFEYEGFPVDLSIRPFPTEDYRAYDAPAKERAMAADASLSSVALDPDGNAWSTLEYEHDRDNSVVTLYPNVDAERFAYYADKICKKFPTFRVIKK